MNPRRTSFAVRIGLLAGLVVLCSASPVPAEVLTPYSGTSPLVVPAAAFHGDSPTASYFFSFSGHLQTAAAGTFCFQAPVVLPAGFEISRFRAHLYDNDPSDFTVSLSRKLNNTTATATLMAAVTTSGQSTTVRSLENTTVANPLVTSDYSYFISTCLSGTGQRIHAAEVHYTVPLGDWVWRDDNGDGIQSAGEPGVPGVIVALYDDVGTLLGTTVTDGVGLYRFGDVGLTGTYRLRFWPPVGFALTAADQGGDDAADSDPHPVTGLTPLFTLSRAQQGFWDAGVVPNCPGPDERVYISSITLTTDGNAYPILTFLDPNQPVTVTGYNIYRSSVASMPPGSWPMVASNVVDMDAATPNAQWIDSSGEVSPTGIWYYNVAAYNSRCPAEGPR